MVCLEACSLRRANVEGRELLGVFHHTLRPWCPYSASARDDSEASGDETTEDGDGSFR